MDDDGDLDLFLANQAGAADAMWRNDGTAFTDVAADSSGMTGPPRTKDEGGVGCAIGDYDNDGDLDIFVPNYGHNQLYRNNDNGTFTDVAAAVGVGVENHAVGADWGDYDNDGDLDLSVISYVGAPGEQQPMNALFRNDGAKGFVNVLTKDSPLNRGDHGVAVGGLTTTTAASTCRITDGYGPVRRPLPVPQHAAGRGKKRSLSVLVLDAQGHQTRFGAEVRLLRRSRARSSRRARCSTGGGYNSQRAAPVHFGLTTLDPVRVEVTFMTREGRKTQSVRRQTGRLLRQEPRRARGQVNARLASAIARAR